MGCEAGRCKASTPSGIFIVAPSLEGRPTKAKEAPSPHEVRLTPLDPAGLLYPLLLLIWYQKKTCRICSKLIIKFFQGF